MTMEDRTIYITHEMSFCAAHKLYNPALSKADNERMFSPCHNDHGHNYKLVVTLKGTVSQETGMLINFRDLASAMRKRVHDVLDHKHLNKDIEIFKTVIPTAENIAFVIWDWLSDELGSDLMHEVRLHETEKNMVVYRGERT